MIDTVNNEVLQGTDAISERLNAVNMEVMRRYGVPQNRAQRRRHEKELRKALVADAKKAVVNHG